MPVLDRKLLRDLARMWAQALAIALVMACGVATIVTAVGAYRSLEETRAAFYDRYRFATVFASLVRAPLHLRDRIATLPDVAGLELRVVKPALLDMPGLAEPATAVVVSMPDAGEAAVNRLYLRAGRLPEPGRNDEVAVTESFATAHRMTAGSRFEAVMNGGKRTLRVTGVVLSPEYVYAIGPGDMVPDQRRFGVLFMRRAALANAYDMDGAFNDVVLRTQRNADLPRLIETLDRILKPYGGLGAHDRTDQTSHAFLDNELVQLRAMAAVIPPVFLFVSAFLVNMILARLIALERPQVGLMKAVGYGSWAIAWHYAKFTIAISIVGVVIGALAGLALGRGLTQLYGEFFSFPFLVFRQSLDLYVIAAAVNVAAGLAGSVRAIWSVARLPPAVAMQPPAPPRYRALFGGGTGLRFRLPPRMSMAFRHLVRWPMRAALAVVGVSLAVAILITAMFSFDSIDYMIETVFFQTERQDAAITFATPLAPAAIHEVARLPGVTRAEGFRAARVVLRNGVRARKTVIISALPGADLSRVLGGDGAPVMPPPVGLMMPKRVAALLDLAVGDKVEVELLERAGRREMVPVTALVESLVGVVVHMDRTALDRLIGDGPRISGANVAVDAARLDDLYAAIKQTPAIASVALQGISRGRFRETIGENITIMMTVYVVLAVIITFGVVYNTARIQLSERAHELANLRVFGFTRGEVSSVLLTELAIIVAAAQPLGWLIGLGFSWSVVRGFESDLFRIPFVIERSTFAMASLVVVLIALASALIVRRRLDRLDLIRVLKTRE